VKDKPMPTRNVVLTKHQEKLIEILVDSGRYQNASEVLREGLRLVEQREAEDAAKLKVLREAARVGFDALDRGEFKEFDSIRDLETYLNDLSEKIISRSTD
jgi:antitoxin ParD1/3/4